MLDRKYFGGLVPSGIFARSVPVVHNVRGGEGGVFF